jgi:hypothetical protein
VLLFFEKLHGDRSFFKPYLDVLPQSYDSPMFWSDTELAEFEYNFVNDDDDAMPVSRRMQLSEDVRCKLRLVISLLCWAWHCA